MSLLPNSSLAFSARAAVLLRNLHIINERKKNNLLEKPLTTDLKRWGVRCGKGNWTCAGQKLQPVNDGCTRESGGEMFNNTYCVPAACRWLGHPGLHCIMWLYFTVVICQIATLLFEHCRILSPTTLIFGSGLHTNAHLKRRMWRNPCPNMSRRWNERSVFNVLVLVPRVQQKSD